MVFGLMCAHKICLSAARGAVRSSIFVDTVGHVCIKIYMVLIHAKNVLADVVGGLDSNGRGDVLDALKTLLQVVVHTWFMGRCFYSIHARYMFQWAQW
jgi:hypothetical protein